MASTYSHQGASQVQQHLLQLQRLLLCCPDIPGVSRLQVYMVQHWGGHQLDGQLCGESDLKEFINDKSIFFPNDVLLSNDDRDTPYFIMGNDAFSLTTYEALGKEGPEQRDDGG